jgi:hypothetical protein
MTSALFIKETGKLLPADEAAGAALEHMKNGARVLVKLKEPRNEDHHRLMFAVLNKVCENSEWQNPEALLDALKIEVGHVERMQSLDGKVYLKPRSIAFDKMDQIDFRRFFDRVMHVICEQIIPGLNKAALENEVHEMLADRRMA